MTSRPTRPLHLLVIGDSHTAALRQAATRFAADWPKLDLDFAAMHGDMTNFTVTDGALTGRRKDDRTRLARISGRASFDLSAYDAVAVCGGAPSVFHAVRLWLKARFSTLPSVARAKPHRLPDWHLLSETCFETALCQMMQMTSAMPLLAALAVAGKTRRFLIPMPLLSVEALSQSRFAGFVQAHAQGDAPALAEMANRSLIRAAQPFATPVLWPDAVRQDGLFARPEFRRGATRLTPGDDVPQPDTDYLHANADYGRHILTALNHLL